MRLPPDASNAPRWPALLERLAGSLTTGGVVAFTTCGRRVAERLAAEDATYALPADIGAQIIDDYRRSGFGYRDYPGATGYGLLLSSLSWALDHALALPGYRVVLCRERAWDDHQDLVAIVREA